MRNSTRQETNVSPAFGVYLDAQEKSEEIHGEKTIVFMQMGSFLEMFHVKFDDGSELGRADDLNDVLTKMGEKQDQIGKLYKGKTISYVSRYGFPFLADAKEKYISIATKRGFSVPVYYQKGNEKDPITKIVPRCLGDIWTPTIQPGDSTFTEWFIGYVISDTISVCAINPRTRSFKYSTFASLDPGTIVVPESADFIRINPPSEVMIWYKHNAILSSHTKLGINEETHVRKANIGRQVVDNSSVFPLLSKSFVIPSDIPEVVSRSFDFLMSTIPDIMTDTHYYLNDVDTRNVMRLENNCLTQLNILEDTSARNVRKRDRSVIGIVNFTTTKMGDRTIKNWITNPSTSLYTIQRRLGLGSHLNTREYSSWESCLKGMIDIDRLFSSEVLGGLSYTLLNGCKDSIKSFVEEDRRYPLYFGGVRYPIPEDECNRFIEKVERDLVSPSTLPYNGSVVGGVSLSMYGEPVELEFPFTREGCMGVESGGGEGDEVWDKYQCYCEKMKILKKIESAMELDLDYNSGTYLFWVRGGKKGIVYPMGEFWRNATKVDSTNAKGRYELSGDSQIIVNNHSYALSELIKEANRARNELSVMIRDIWVKWSRSLREEYESLVMIMSNLIGEVDAVLSGIKCIRVYGYTYPIVKDDSAWIKTKGLRHPLIESIQQDVSYVPHNIDIDTVKRGRLLFGVNSSGKSSLMKAIGISIILAQAGLPVPALSFELGIYHSMFTRILGNDNIFQGMSTFAVESSELLRIMKSSNERSMVLGDELCSGTEQYGAEAIVASSILTLLKRDVSFVFATHWHRLRDLPDLRSHPNLVWNHLRVDCTEDGKMVMYRTLEDGPGPRGYAIEYMKNMGADPEMIEEAIRIRKLITSEDFAIKSVRSWNGGGDATAWNSKVKIQSVCQVCKERPVEETDHIVPRETATAEGAIAGVGSVHHGGNLVGLCKSCHHKKTHGLLEIYGYNETRTPNGIISKELQWESRKAEPVREKTIGHRDDIKDFIIKFAASGSSVRQIQGAMKRNGFTVSQSFIRDTLSDHNR